MLETHPDMSVISIWVHFSNGVHELIYHSVSGSVAQWQNTKYIKLIYFWGCWSFAKNKVVKLVQLCQRLLKTNVKVLKHVL